MPHGASASGSRPWAPGPGRVPGFAHSLLCPSVLHGIELERLPDLEGLAAFRPPTDEPWVYDASLVLSLELDAIRSSTRLNTSAPIPSDTAAATAR